MRKLFYTLLLSFSIQLVVSQPAKDVNEVTITVSDINRSIKFFSEVLTFKIISIDTIQDKSLNDLFAIDYKDLKIIKAKMKIGNEQISLMQFVHPTNGREIPLDSKSNDLWFQHIAIVVDDMEKAYAILKSHKVVHVSTMPQELPDYIPAAAGIKAFYFRDPDGHNLEIIYFPEGKGNPKWKTIKNNSPFIGIDHTAIGISNTDINTAYYSDTIGLKVAGNSINYGTEQEHLNQVFGAHLLITGLKANKGFGVEFLEYIAPPGGRKYPTDSKVTDLWHWHTTIEVEDIEMVYKNVSSNNRSRIISNKISNISGFNFGGNKGFLSRDPDGHVILFVE